MVCPIQVEFDVVYMVVIVGLWTAEVVTPESIKMNLVMMIPVNPAQMGITV